MQIPESSELFTALASPALYRNALDIVCTIVRLRGGETVSNEVFQRRLSTLIFATDWLAFIMAVAGSDRHVAGDVMLVMWNLAYGSGCSKEGAVQVARAVPAILRVMQIHESSYDVIKNCVGFFWALTVNSHILPMLQQLSVQEAILKVSRAAMCDAMMKSRCVIVLDRLR